MSNNAQCQLSDQPPPEEWSMVSQFPHEGDPKPIILWDGACGLCFESVLWLKAGQQSVHRESVSARAEATNDA